MGRRLVAPVVPGLRHVDLDLGGAEGALHHLAPLERIARKREALEIGAQVLPAEPRVHEGAENHVTGGAAGAVEVGETHGFSAPWRRGG